MFDIAAVGEALIDFTECGRSETGGRLFEQNPGGAPANLLAAAARLGARTAFLGKVGSDMHGRFLRDTMAGAGIDVSGLRLDETVFTTLAFVALSPAGERTFSFARKPGADTQLCPDELEEGVLRAARILHIGSLSMTDEPARSATLSAIRTAKAAGAWISYDPNYRAALWADEAEAKRRMRELLPYADVVKLSDEETALLTDAADPAEAACRLNAQGIACAAVTLGAAGAIVAVRGETRRVPGHRVPVVDTTGAGDAFFGAFLWRMLQAGRDPASMTPADAEDCAAWGNAAAARCIQKRGGIPAMPTSGECRAQLQR